LQALVGHRNVISPSLSQLTETMGLESLIGKRVAIVPDARVGDRQNHHAIAERLLSISGEDTISFNRKYKTYWDGRLGVRFIIFSNELPGIRDSSGTIVSRFIILKLTESWFGREDVFLLDRLKFELPGIFNWAVTGWRRLSARGRFLQPRSAEDLIVEFDALSAPMKLFLNECCKIGAGESCLRELLYQKYRSWCLVSGVGVVDIAVFGKSLRAMVPTLKTTRPRACGERHRIYEGIGLRSDV